MTLASALKRGLADIAVCIRFYSRLPMPRLPWEAEPHRVPDLAAIGPMLPLVGAALGGIAAAVLCLALWLGFGPWPSAALAVAAQTLATGAFHEDGLADTADSLGGTSRERRLEIMKDSRIGSFGACALILAFALRISALAALSERLDAVDLAAALGVAGAVSRTAALFLFAALRPARTEGASYALPAPTGRALAIAAAVAALLAAGLGTLAALPLAAVLLALVLPAAVALGMTLFAARLLGGHTGDIGGATQQIGEIAVLLALLAAARA